MTTETITVDGRDIEVVRDGSTGLFPLVFHCGTPNAPDEFPQLFDAVERKGWQLVAHARPGYAGSSRHEGRTVADIGHDGPRAIHSLHGYFVRPGDDDHSIRFAVDKIRDGRSFSTRRVQASTFSVGRCPVVAPSPPTSPMPAKCRLA